MSDVLYSRVIAFALLVVVAVAAAAPR